MTSIGGRNRFSWCACPSTVGRALQWGQEGQDICLLEGWVGEGKGEVKEICHHQGSKATQGHQALSLEVWAVLGLLRRSGLGGSLDEEPCAQ